MVYVEDVGSTFSTALAAGATEIQAVEVTFYGDRSGMFKDPWGHEWTVATHVEDIPEEEMGAPHGRDAAGLTPRHRP